MEERNDLRMTALDEAIGDNRLQMMKAAIPYINMSEQKFLAVYAKIRELTNTIGFYSRSSEDDLSACSLESDSKDPLAMLNDMRPFAADSDAEMIDTMINFMNAFELYHSYQEMMSAQEAEGESGTSDPMAMLKAFLPPEQQSMFDTYSMMFNNMG